MQMKVMTVVGARAPRLANSAAPNTPPTAPPTTAAEESLEHRSADDTARSGWQTVDVVGVGVGVGKTNWPTLTLTAAAALPQQLSGSSALRQQK
ncbi:hypothetical protein L249_8206 [Ophiocordyceps polyrhachis-furcata BCC 54312]|uniref:Uncharacterized protein n=1 Tax=Ophiocordyceps polyrhachis-furcata BCC 54312 TaxID=1330021 RepID=A0A367LHJ5_9HYPO|nr:hypothetical protein L249_8206 [Ophiocordyceps polyrhachis-furcata BCC 54312]